MPKKKQISRTLLKSEVRLASLKAISPELDLGANLTLADYSALINELRQTIGIYNTTLSTIENLQTRIKTLESTLGDLSEKMLVGVAHVYGKDSEEYEMAGGVRKSNRKPRTTRPQPSSLAQA
jgi:hypothetical protein